MYLFFYSFSWVVCYFHSTRDNTLDVFRSRKGLPSIYFILGTRFTQRNSTHGRHLNIPSQTRSSRNQRMSRSPTPFIPNDIINTPVGSPVAPPHRLCRTLGG